jgi:NAD(P)-dependent dehydrogenase (short-subunit alcohol dehydrogenase family)
MVLVGSEARLTCTGETDRFTVDGTDRFLTLEVAVTAIKGATVFVTGGGRGIGKELVEELYARGAGKVYATARDPRTVAHPHAVPLALEVTDPASVAAAAEQAQDVTILINNAGASAGASYLDSAMEDVRRDLETNFYGPLLVTRAFAPIIEPCPGWLTARPTARPRPRCGRRPIPCAWSCGRAASR